MTPEAIITATAAALGASVMGIALFGFVPWASRIGTLYVLHNLRDGFYRRGGELGMRDTLVYTDIEYLLNLALFAVRSRDDGLILDGLKFAPMRGKPDNWRTFQYDQLAKSEGVAKVDALTAYLLPLVGLMLLHLFSQRPHHLVAIAVLLIPRLALLALGYLPGPLERLAVVVEELPLSLSRSHSSLAA